MSYGIDAKAIAAANPKIDLSKIEQAIAMHRKIKESGVLTPKPTPASPVIPTPDRKRRRMRSYKTR